MRMQKNFSLRKMNAFGVDERAKYFTEINDTHDILSLIHEKILQKEECYILGQGWNTLFTKDFDGVVIKMHLKKRNIIHEDANKVILEVGAGEDWIDLVNFAIAHHWAGIENLSFIPGTVGAAVFQDIGAYGQNFDDVFIDLDAINLETGAIETFDKEACAFAYRESIFKTKLRNRFIIVTIRIQLGKQKIIDTTYHSRYGSLLGELSKCAKPPFDISDVAKAVISIRKTKFPDWKKTGTAGSFFLNPVITKGKLRELQAIVPEVQYYPIEKLTYPMPDDPTFDHANHVKVAAGWLLEELGWKGKRIGNVGTSPNQALVVINYGNATAKEILQFTDAMQKDFEKRYNITLAPEVNIV